MLATLRQLVSLLLLWVSSWLKCGLVWVESGLVWVERGLTTFRARGRSAPGGPGKAEEPDDDALEDAWRTDRAARTYRCHGHGPMVTVETSTHAFYVDLEHLADCSEYFGALSRSCMRETAEQHVQLNHLPSEAVHGLLQFCFLQRYCVPHSQLAQHIQVSSYLLAHAFTSRCLAALAQALTAQTCTAYLELAAELCCPELQETVLTYLSRHLLELPHLSRGLDPALQDQLLSLRSKGVGRLCCLRKENLTLDPETEAARRLYCLEGSEVTGEWRGLAELPFVADKWCFTTAVLFNYLYLLGGYRHRARRGYEFKMASFRYNPYTQEWASTAPLIKHRRHFSAAVCAGSIFAVGGWYLDSLATPDSGTGLYTAVERYDPWADAWAFVASLPLTDFRFTLSLSHDSPLAASLGHCLYVLGNIQRTGEKLLLQYDTRQDSWSELLPTLTRADANIPSLHFLGATDRLFVIGGNNSETVVTSFCVESKKWGRVRAMEKTALIGQGTVLNDELYMSGTQHDSVVRLHLHSLSLSTLPPLPFSTCYESLFHLHF